MRVVSNDAVPGCWVSLASNGGAWVANMGMQRSTDVSWAMDSGESYSVHTEYA